MFARKITTTYGGLAKVHYSKLSTETKGVKARPRVFPNPSATSFPKSFSPSFSAFRNFPPLGPTPHPESVRHPRPDLFPVLETFPNLRSNAYVFRSFPSILPPVDRPSFRTFSPSKISLLFDLTQRTAPRRSLEAEIRTRETPGRCEGKGRRCGKRVRSCEEAAPPGARLRGGKRRGPSGVRRGRGRREATPARPIAPRRLGRKAGGFQAPAKRKTDDESCHSSSVERLQPHHERRTNHFT